MKPEDGEHMRVAERLAGELSLAGLDVLVDDRVERPGVKFKDADLIGIPLRLTIGEKALAAGGVELKGRADAGKGEVVNLLHEWMDPRFLLTYAFTAPSEEERERLE